MSVISIFYYLIFLTSSLGSFTTATSEDSSSPPTSYFDACANGLYENVEKYIADHPEHVNGRTVDGETCLHLAAIGNSLHITEFLLEKGADPNIRTLSKQGLRMHPLSWNVYGGNHEIVDLLMKHGADPNLDFDSPTITGDDGDRRMTCLDQAERIANAVKDKNDTSNRYLVTYNLLLDSGAKKFEDL